MKRVFYGQPGETMEHGGESLHVQPLTFSEGSVCQRERESARLITHFLSNLAVVSCGGECGRGHTLKGLQRLVSLCKHSETTTSNRIHSWPLWTLQRSSCCRSAFKLDGLIASGFSVQVQCRENLFDDANCSQKLKMNPELDNHEFFLYIIEPIDFVHWCNHATITCLNKIPLGCFPLFNDD